MVATTVAIASQVQKWDATFFAEYVRNSGFLPYMGRGTMKPICTKYELSSGGKTINIPLVTRLTGAGVTGSTALEGAEEALGNYNQAITIDWLRNGVLITKDQQHWTEMDLRRAARDQLSNWAMSGLRDDIIVAAHSIDGVAYGTATEVQKDAWLANNTDRVLFGSAKANTPGDNDHSDGLAAVDNTNDKLSRAAVSLMKRMAKTADRHIRPMRVDDGTGREYFVLFCNSFQFRDFKADMDTVNLDGRPRNTSSNPVFQDGDMIYDGVIVREIPEIPVLAGVGAAAIDVAPAFFMGAQAIGVAWGQEPKSTTDKRDYDFYRGVGIEEARGVEKMRFNNKDNGLVTGYFASVGD